MVALKIATNEAPASYRAESNWSGGPGFEPGPEICAVSSTEHVFETFELTSSTHRPISSRFQPPTSLGLLHELLHGPTLMKAPA
jgi:hypothetical protein